MMGNVLFTLLRQGGLTSLLIIALVGRKAELEIGLAFLIIESSMLFRLIAAPHVDVTWRKRFLVRWMGISSVCSALLLVVPAIALAGHEEVGMWALLVVLAAYFFTTHAGAAAWFPLLHTILPPSLRGRYFGNMRMAWQVVGFGAVFLSGAALGRDPGLSRFYLVLVPAVILQFGRVWKYSQLPDPPPAQTRRDGIGWRAMLVPLRDAPYRHFLGFVVLASITLHAVVPFVVPFLKSELDFPASVTLCGTGCLGLGSILSLVRWGRLADRWGTRLVFLLSCSVTAGGFVMVASVPSYRGGALVAGAVAFVALALVGVGTAGTGIAYTVRLMRMVPEANASTYLNMTQAALGIASGLTAAAVGALLRWLPATFDLLSYSLPTFRAFFLLTVLGLAAILALIRFLPRLGEPSLRQAAGTALGRLRRTLPGR